MNGNNFEKKNVANIRLMGKNKRLGVITKKWLLESYPYEYSYHFKWLGRPIIQYPQDIIALQEIIWNVKPDLIIETGVAHGGSLIFSASMLDLIGKGKVIGIDIDIRKHNKKAIKNHFLSKRIHLIEGSSTEKAVVDRVYSFAKMHKRTMLILDSNHTYKHVLREMELYSHLVTKGSYMVVLDTIIDDLPQRLFVNRPWGRGNNPKTAVKDFLKKNKQFRIDKEIENKLLITVGPSGYLKRVRQ